MRSAMIVLGALVLGGCASRAPIHSPTGDGARWFSITCPWGSESCYEQAAAACPNGYDVDQRSTKAGKPRNFSAWRNTLIRCKEPGEAAEETSAPSPKKTAKKEKTDDGASTSQLVQSARWKFTLPAGWTVQKGSKATTARDDEGRHTVTFTVAKTEGAVVDLAAERFKGWHGKHEATLGNREVILADDFDGANQVTSVLLVVDGVVYQLTCVDVDQGTVSATCAAIVKSLRVQDTLE